MKQLRRLIINKKVNRPHDGVVFADMVEGLRRFTKRFLGETWLEILEGFGAIGTIVKDGMNFYVANDRQ